MRSLQELVSTHEPALPLVQQGAAEGGLPCELLPPHAARDAVGGFFAIHSGGLGDVRTSSRRPVAVAEQYGANMDVPRP